MAEQFTNLARSTLASGITAVATSLTVQTGDGNNLFPSLGAGEFFRCLLFKKSTGDVEFIKVTARSADVFTIERAAESVGNVTATAYAFDAGDLIELRPTKAYFDTLTVADTEIQRNAYNYAVDSGSVNNYVVTLSPAPSAYANGMTVIFKPFNANNGASTLNVNALGAVSILKHGNIPLVSGDILANTMITVTYTSTGPAFILDTPSQVPPTKIIPQGTGTTLDADKVDGQHAADLLARGNHTGVDDLSTDVNGILRVDYGGTQKANWTRGAILTGNIDDESIIAVAVNATTVDLTISTATGNLLAVGNTIVVSGTIVGSGDLVTDLPGQYFIASKPAADQVRISLTTTGSYTSGGILETPLIGVNSSASGQLYLSSGLDDTGKFLTNQGTAVVHGLVSGGAGADPAFSRVAVPTDFFVQEVSKTSSSGNVTHTFFTGFGGNDYAYGLAAAVRTDGISNTAYRCHLVGSDGLLVTYVCEDAGEVAAPSTVVGGYPSTPGTTGAINMTFQGAEVDNRGWKIKVWARKNIT